MAGLLACADACGSSGGTLRFSEGACQNTDASASLCSSGLPSQYVYVHVARMPPVAVLPCKCMCTSFDSHVAAIICVYQCVHAIHNNRAYMNKHTQEYTRVGRRSHPPQRHSTRSAADWQVNTQVVGRSRLQPLVASRSGLRLRGSDWLGVHTVCLQK